MRLCSIVGLLGIQDKPRPSLETRESTVPFTELFSPSSKSNSDQNIDTDLSFCLVFDGRLRNHSTIKATWKHVLDVL